jgi:pectinesterase
MACVPKPPFRQHRLTVGSSEDCQFKQIQSAIDFADKLAGSCEIVIDEGIYAETIKIYRNQLSLVGKGSVEIVASCGAFEKDEQGKVRGTFQTATLFINGEDIYMENIRVANQAGMGNQVGQAVAVYLEGTNLSFVSCLLDAYQDTLCLGPLPAKNKTGLPLESPWVKKSYPVQESMFYQCDISGTVDFIFGGGSACFYQCRIHCKNSPQTNYLTAASTPLNQKGFTFSDCVISGDKPYYLGRPWRKYAKTLFTGCRFDAQLVDAGWHDWQLTDRSTVHYREENCYYTKLPVRDSWLTIKGAKDYEEEH